MVVSKLFSQQTWVIFYLSRHLEVPSFSYSRLLFCVFISRVCAVGGPLFTAVRSETSGTVHLKWQGEFWYRKKKEYVFGINCVFNQEPLKPEVLDLMELYI
jgi:hypothetical protein